MVRDNFFTPLENTTPWWHVGFQGGPGTGKSYTQALLAIGLHKYIKSTKPIVIIDTERSAKFLRPLYREAGIKVSVKATRSLKDLMEAMRACQEGYADILSIDSMTHIYLNFCEAHRKAKGRKRIQFQDWQIIKPDWAEKFTRPYVEGDYHILFTGREGFTYEYIENEDGKKELTKTGVKMKTETDTAHEPDTVIRMVRCEELKGRELKVWREATIIKGRCPILDGKVFTNPTFEDFLPELDFLFDNIQPVTGGPEGNDQELVELEDNYREERGACKIQLERNNALLDKVAAGTTKESKVMRLSLIEQSYDGESSETAIARLNNGQLLLAHDILAPLVEQIVMVLRREERIYPVDKAIVAARSKYLDTNNLGEAALEKLKHYNEHMVEKYEEIQAKATNDKQEKVA